MKKILFVICLLLLVSFTIVGAQDEDGEESLSQRFPTLKFKDQFNQVQPVKYYRFPPDTFFFEPLDLSYFPHEMWYKDEWALLGRWKDGKTYNQTLYFDEKPSSQVFHGTDIGKSYGSFGDFYLYTDLFVVDNYPKDTGSCYLYYSNSIMTGFGESHGILIDPSSGIYTAENFYGDKKKSIYDQFYSQYLINHSLKRFEKLDPKEFVFDPDDIAGSSVGASCYPQAKLDEQFAAELDALNSSYRNPAASPVKAYRIEVVREAGISEIYINGKKAASFEDNILTKDKEPDKVSFSYGPTLRAGGLVVTCSIGDLYIYTK